ncbi:replicative DNA helicase [[Mycoplasma] testudinis]|uniref:replicative DNA helicase n=1 Tax=[Mycoplasma] testudinis TaxID=33924 RepID=UPI000698B374|nr:replicative DNA helicase [[Mycoplasma] testudinis]
MNQNTLKKKIDPLTITPELGVEAEGMVLSALLNNLPNSDDAFNKLTVKDFEDEAYRLIFNVMLSLFKSNTAIESTLVIENLISKKLATYQEATEAISTLLTLKPTAKSLENYFSIVKMASILRDLKLLGQDMQNLEVDSANFDDRLVEIEQRFLSISKSKVGSEIVPLKEHVQSFRDKLKRAMEGDIITGTQTGYTEIDKITNGFQPGDLIILAARPGKGKTALSINFLINSAKNLKDNEVVVMFSLEMGVDQILHRMAACESMVNFTFANFKSLSPEDNASISYSLNEVEELPILIDDSSDLTITEIQSRLKQIANTHTLKLVIVDYLQLLKATKQSNGMNRQQEVTLISHGLKQIARDLNVPVLSIAQLSRKIEERRGPDSTPILSDLRESGSIEQDADLVCFLNTVIHEGELEQNEVLNENPEIEFIIAKHRNGPTGKAVLSFNKRIGKFQSVTYDVTFPEDN